MTARPVLFRQERSATGGRPFRILKFRSMRDGRVTRVGRLAARHGPRRDPAVGQHPARRHECGRAASADCRRRRPSWLDRRRIRLSLGVPARADGLAQLLGARADDDALLFDRVHAGRWRPSLDCQLIAWSFAVNAFGKSRVRRWLRVYDPANVSTFLLSLGPVSARERATTADVELEAESTNR